MSYTEKEVHDFLDFLVTRIKDQNRDIEQRIAQFHDQRCENPTPECKKITTDAMKEAVLAAVLYDDLRARGRDVKVEVVSLNTFKKMTEGNPGLTRGSDGTGFYL